MDPKRIKRFQKEILGWYQKNKRDLPWRRTRDPYHILVSEIMLQQTQVSRVMPKYEEWLKRFPTIESLAKAKTADVLRLWSGLGYNRRALYLKRIAEIISYDGRLLHAIGDARGPAGRFPRPMSSVDKLPAGTRRSSSSYPAPVTPRVELTSTAADCVNFPHAIEELKKLPGIGEYTARAVACFAFDQQVAVVDTNIRKVILLKFGKPNKSVSQQISGSVGQKNQTIRQSDSADLPISRFTEREIQEFADQLLPAGRAYDWNHALMDYSAVMLKNHEVPIAKQSLPAGRQGKFIGSNRYYRGQIIKLLLAKKTMSKKQLASHLEKDGEWLKGITNSLIRDGLIQKSEGYLSLKT